jgi:hypothetical protein
VAMAMRVRTINSQCQPRLVDETDDMWRSVSASVCDIFFYCCASSATGIRALRAEATLTGSRMKVLTKTVAHG